jgi:hypothetical protein
MGRSPMNKTNELISFFARDRGIRAEQKDGPEALEFFQKIYPGIVYHSETDSFRYRKYDFDYFKSGINIEGKGNSYILVSKNDGNRYSTSDSEPFFFRNWLFQHGNPEERWWDFIKREELYLNEIAEADNKGWFEKLLNFLGW